MFFQVRLEMMKLGWISRLPKECSTRVICGGVGVALLLAMGGRAVAQADQAPAGTVQQGYVIHNTADLGGHIVTTAGSGAMYDTLVNVHSGPRVLGQTFTMHAVPGTKHGLFDDLTAFSGGFGGDPNNFAKMDISKGKLYEFTGNFRRDRQYFDYNLLDSPNLPVANIPYGYVNGVATAQTFQYQHLQDSGMMFNTVRRMMDTDLTILPLSKVTFRAAYSHSIFQGPSTMTNRSIGKYDALLRMYQRNSTDDFTAAVDWKPVQHTKLSFEELVDHYKADSYFTLDPSDFIAQEADGTPVALGNYDALPSATAPVPYGSSASGVCATGSMGSGYTSATTYNIFSAPLTPGGLPVINPACDAITSYLRTQPTRSIYPTEMFRFQSTSIKNIALNGDVRYSVGNTNMANYYENWQGFDVSTSSPAGGFRSATVTGNSHAQRRVVAIDYGMTWDATKAISLSDQVEFSNVHQPGTATASTGATLETPATTGNETINYSGPLTAGAAYSITGNPSNSTLLGYFSQRWLTNNATATWDASTQATLSLTYRYRTHRIVRNNPLGSNEWDINENAGILNATVRPTKNWDLNGSAEIAYNDSAFTPMTPRQVQHYRVHTLYRAKPWATISGAYNDLERHNNTYNTGTTNLDGPLQHQDHSRYASLGVSMAPNEHYAFDFNYSYSDVYITTNACYSNGTVVSATAPTTVVFVGAASNNSAGTANICPSLNTEWGPVKDFMDAPTQYASASLSLTPNKQIHADLGYRISAVSGNQFFNDAQEVKGSLQSAYQSPYLNLAWTVHPGWVWRAEYNYYGYGEGGTSGAQFCSTYTASSAPVVPCSNFPGLTAVTMSPAGFTAPRNFHANNVTIGMHYEF
jgi:hypothetical protein